MRANRGVRGGMVLCAMACALGLVFAQDQVERKHNVIIFVADGLRYGSINRIDTPAFWSVRTQGVDFANSHSMFPTLTMANAAAIATGHYSGDTGQFGNYLFIGHPLFSSGNFGRRPGTLTPNMESIEALGDVTGYYGGNYLREASLLAFARSYGYKTAAIGKNGPAAIQDLTGLAPRRGVFREPATIIIDSETGTAGGFPMRASVKALLASAGLGFEPPPRRQPGGTNTTRGTREANVVHQQWFADVTTKAILPSFATSSEPFFLVFWAGDPDQTQHAQGDSLNTLTPGINGPTSKAAIRNADRNLQQILDYINADQELRDTTNIFVTSDHGFSTVSRHEIDGDGRVTSSYSAGFTYRDASGRQEVNDGYLPAGFAAIDLAHALNLPLYDPDTQVTDADGVIRYARVDPTIPQETAQVRQRPLNGNDLIGGTGRIVIPSDAEVVMTGHGAVYLPGYDKQMAQRVVRLLETQDYVGGLFVHDRFGQIEGALPMSRVGLVGPTVLPQPAIIINFKSFSTNPKDPLMTSVIVGGTQQHGQGGHGPLNRANSFNNMAAIGPDFKKGFVSQIPASNADIKSTLAQALGLKFREIGPLRGRALAEAIAGGPSNVRYDRKVARSRPALSGRSTVLLYQEAGGRLYFDEACFTSETGQNPCQ